MKGRIITLLVILFVTLKVNAQFYGGYVPMPPPPMFVTPPPEITNPSWNSTPMPQYYGNVPTYYGSDPCVNAAIGVARSEQRLMNEGVTITHPRDNSENHSSKSNPASRDSGWYDCCSKVATFGQDTYHECQNCGVRHKMGSHMCKKR